MAIAEIFLTAFIEVLFEKLASGDLWNFAQRERIDTQLEKWSRMLQEIGAVLADAEEKQMTDQWGGIKLWLEDLEDLAYDLDDVLDEIATEALREKVREERRASTSKVFSFVPTCCTSFFWIITCCTSFNPSTLFSGLKMRSQIDDITARLNDLFERRTRLGLHIVNVGPSPKAPQRPPTSSLIQEPRLYGRNGDKKVIIELLLSDQSSNGKVGVVPIVGMGGVGKTTIARDVYNDEVVGKHFEMKAWVCVSEVFEIVSVTKAILESVTSQTCRFNALDQVQVELKKALTGKKFLIVLDDVWNKNLGDWISLKSPFNDGATGSKIMVTTRNRDVGSMMAGIDNFHFLKELSDDDCWSVFAQHAFENRSVDESQNLVSIGRKIVQKCGGLPLAARTLGGLLRCKLRDDEWDDVLKSKMWELPGEENDILPALRLSYYHLPSQLKKCFGYCSVLPKDYEFEEKELVLLWMAEGLIEKPTGEKQMEDLGFEYFRELSSRSFFQPSSSGRDSLFIMHDLINVLAQFVARRICFRMEEKLENNERVKIITHARYSSYTREYRDGKKKFEAFQKAKNLRSFLPIGSRDEESYLTHDVPLHLLPKLRRLRVLSLRGYQIAELSSWIGDLKHVRFLDLSRALIATLPESITTLYNLQTLILRDCTNLSKLPGDTSNLLNLRHLDVTGANSLQAMPPKIGKLTSLQTLSNFIVGKGDGFTINELGNLIHLRGTLCISGLEKVVDALDARKANLKHKQGLDELSMNWSYSSDHSSNGRVDSEILAMLEPHRNLKVLTFSGYRGLKFPTWVGNCLFSNMVSLKFQNCNKCTSFAPVGQLPSLGTLEIAGMDAIENIGREFYGSGCSNYFPSLWNLTFEDMLEWKYWSHFEVEDGAQAFSCLSQLSIKRCPKLLGKLPSNLPCLKNLNIEECPQLVVAWIPSPPEIIEVRNSFHFDSLISLSLKNVSIPASYGNPEVGNEAEQENTRYSHLSSLTSLTVENIQGLTCLSSWLFQGLTGLQELYLYDSKELTSLWNSEVRIHHRLPALQRLVIKRCPLLISLFEEEEEEGEGLQQQNQHVELPYIMMLEYLEINNCEKLEKLPQGLHNLKSLQELIIKSCPCLISFPNTGFPPALKRLTIYTCAALRFLPGLMMLNCLERLGVRNCQSLTYLSCAGTGLPPTLRRLYIGYCENLESVTAEQGTEINCPSLEYVEIEGCKSLKSLSDVMPNCLERLEVRNCQSLTYLSCAGTGLPPTLQRLVIWNCENLESVIAEQGTEINCPFLEYVEIEGCKSLKSLPDVMQNNNGGCLRSLSELCISNCENVESIPEGWFTSTNLRELSIHGCKTFKGLLQHAYNNLTELRISIVSMGGKSLSEWSLHRLSSLRILWLYGYGGASFPPKEEDGMMSWLPPSLKELSIRTFPNLEKLSCKDFRNISSLESLGIWNCANLTTITKLGQLSSLSRLWIMDCPNIATFSIERQGELLPPSLLHLWILECPILKERCQKKKGQYWPHISHIPDVEIDGSFVFDPTN